MLRLLKSVINSVVEAIWRDPEVQRTIVTHPRLWAWLAKRFSATERFGLLLTIGTAVSFGFLLLFFSVVEDLISQDPLVRADLRVVSLLQVFRNPHLNNIVLFFTYLGNWQIVLAGASALLIYFAVARQWPQILAILAAVGGGEILVWAGKTAFARPRPDLVNALIPAQGLSFPSGHAFVAVSFYGLVSWFLFDSAKTKTAKVLIVVFTLETIFAIGFSRIYLGVHWPSDVLASFCLGAAWLTATITVFSVARASASDVNSRPRHALVKALAAILLLAWIGYVGAFYVTYPLISRAPPELASIELGADDFPETLFARAPRFSEDITGNLMEPINVILLGSEAEVAKTFATAGWEPTDKVSIASSWHLIVTELLNQRDPRAPGLPTFWQGKPNQRGFEHEATSGSVRERHHIHLWDTAFHVSGSPVWLGTVHFDNEAKTASGRGLLIHQVDPAIDQEREALRTDFLTTNCVQKLAEVAVTKQMLGQNAAGNPFFTDGKALTGFLKCR